MHAPIRVLFWSTSFQADVWSLAMHLAQDPGFFVQVALDDARTYRGEPLGRLASPPFLLLERQDPASRRAIRAFAPDVVVVDNHFPKRRLAPALFVLWHGFGWKGPNDKVEFKSVYRAIKHLTGTCPSRPNPRFLWQCYGPTDLEHRHLVSGFARENLRALGAAMTDDLVPQRFSNADILPFYPPSFAQRPVALLAFTWHYGSVFAHWGDDLAIFESLFAELSAQGYAIIVRMHDRHRYDPAYLTALEAMSARHPDLVFKYKNDARDNLLDLSIASLAMSNYSSILNYFYATGRPNIHVYPVASEQEAFLWRTWKGGKLRVQKVPSARYVWKLPPEEHGGLLARSLEELHQHIRLAARDPHCCRQQAATFIQRHMSPCDGQVCERIATELRALALANR